MSTNEYRIGATRHSVHLVGFYFLFPERLGHNAEHGSGVEIIRAIGENRQFEVAQSSCRPVGCTQRPPPCALEGLGKGGFESAIFCCGQPSSSESNSARILS